MGTSNDNLSLLNSVVYVADDDGDPDSFSSFPHSMSIASQHILHNTQDFDKFLKERPAPEELVEKNILKGIRVGRRMRVRDKN